MLKTDDTSLLNVSKLVLHLFTSQWTGSPGPAPGQLQPRCPCPVSRCPWTEGSTATGLCPCAPNECSQPKGSCEEIWERSWGLQALLWSRRASLVTAGTGCKCHPPLPRSRTRAELKCKGPLGPGFPVCSPSKPSSSPCFAAMKAAPAAAVPCVQEQHPPAPGSA